MKQKIFNHTSLLVVLSVLLTFMAASAVMYNRFYDYMKDGVKNEAEYIRIGLKDFGTGFLTEEMGNATSSRITLADPSGMVIFDSNAVPEDLTNHSDRPEVIQAEKEGRGEAVRFSETFSQQTYYYALRLEDGSILRVSKVMDSVFRTFLSSFTLMGILMIVILVLEVFLLQKNIRSLIEPINQLDLEKPLDNVCYDELRPLLVRVDQQNRQIAGQMEELKAAQAMRQEFSANVSHELKTPLMSISGYAELMMNGLVEPENIPVFSGRIYDEASRLTNLVTDIIQLSRLDEKSSTLSFEAIDINELAEDVANNLKQAAEKKEITLTYEGCTAVIRGVHQVVYEMFYNLADNAVRYTPQGGHVQISVGREEGKPFYSVKDDGIGIAPNEQKRVFERFYRVDKSHSRSTGGTGLGLSIVKHGASLHNARIQMDSAPGKGTCIRLLF